MTTAWREERIPPEWSVGKLVSIHKKEDRLDCENYRGICLLSIGYKLFAKILCARLGRYYMDIVGNYQAGFKAGNQPQIRFSPSDKYLKSTENMIGRAGTF